MSPKMTEWTVSRLVLLFSRPIEGRGRQTLSVRQSLEQVGHAEEVVLGIDRVHDLRVVRSRLHVAQYRVAILIGSQAAVELAREAVQAVAGFIHIGPPHGQRQIRIGECAVDDTTPEARLVAASALAIAAKAGGRVEDGRAGHVPGVSVDAPVPVRLGALEAALAAQHVLAQLHEPAVPWEEIGHEVDLCVEGEVGPDQLVVARGHGVDGGVLLLWQVVEADGGAEVLGLFGIGELAPLLADLRVGAAASGPGDDARASGSREGENGEDRRGKHRDENE